MVIFAETIDVSDRGIGLLVPGAFKFLLDVNKLCKLTCEILRIHTSAIVRHTSLVDNNKIRMGLEFLN